MHDSYKSLVIHRISCEIYVLLFESLFLSLKYITTILNILYNVKTEIKNNY